MTRATARRIVPLSVNGRPAQVSADRSLLVTLLSAGEAIDYYCGIGQCYRCECLIGNRRRRACMYYPKGGESVHIVRSPQHRPVDGGSSLE